MEPLDGIFSVASGNHTGTGFLSMGSVHTKCNNNQPYAESGSAPPDLAWEWCMKSCSSDPSPSADPTPHGKASWWIQGCYKIPVVTALMSHSPILSLKRKKDVGGFTRGDIPGRLFQPAQIICLKTNWSPGTADISQPGQNWRSEVQNWTSGKDITVSVEAEIDLCLLPVVTHCLEPVRLSPFPDFSWFLWCLP